MTSRLLVVGGGIAGFGMVRALLLRGVPCTLVERLSAPPVAGTGAEPARATRCGRWRRSGWPTRSSERGVPIRRREYRNKAGRLLFAVDEEAFWGAVGPSVCLRRGDLLDILRAATAR